MKPNYTHISMVLDRSGSMGSVKNDTIGGFNQFLTEQQAVPGECTLTLVQFDSEAIDTLYDCWPIASAGKLTEKTYQPRGSTPLWDAIAETIIKTGDALKGMAEAKRPGKVVLVTLTDGEENCSRKFTHGQVRDMVKHQSEVYKWEFVFLGKNIDSYAVGGSIGTQSMNTMSVGETGAAVASAFVATGSNLRSYRMGATHSMAYSAKQREEQDEHGAKNKAQKKK